MNTRELIPLSAESAPGAEPGASEARFERMARLSSDAYWESDAQLRISFVSDGILRMSEMDPALLIGSRWWELESTADVDKAAQMRLAMQAQEKFVDVIVAMHRPDGRPMHISFSGEPVFDERGGLSGYFGIAMDITVRMRAEETLGRLEHYDTLTDLPNRSLLIDHIRHASARADRSETLLAVLFLDLDQFKEINTTLGHVIGDEVLLETARRLQKCLRTTDTIARVSGDEFAVLLEGFESVDQITLVGQNVLAALSQPVRIGEHELYVSASIGMSVYPLDSQHADTLIRNADQAMHHAKREGRNNVEYFSREMGARTKRRLDLRARLRHALERQEFSLHYQPQVEFHHGRVIGTEALIRWHEAELGPVPPAQFIPIAEETGLIVEIGEWVLREACQQGMAWHAAGHRKLSVAVNLSPRQFRRKNLVQMIDDTLRRTGFPPECLELEITEGTIMQRTEESLASLHQLRELGVRISVDDFGTGYSSLAYLQRFPVHTLKVDQSFVRDIHSGRGGAVIVKTVISLGKHLGLKTLAEGVETENQLLFLKANGCDAYQGFLFSKPMPAAEISELLATKAVRARARARSKVVHILDRPARRKRSA